VTCYTLDQVEVDCRQGNDYSWWKDDSKWK
jgi:hypothetical protein